MCEPELFCRRGLAACLLIASVQAGSALAQTWFEIDREAPPAGQIDANETLTEVDLDTLRRDASGHAIVARVTWDRPRWLPAGTARSVLARLQIACPTMLVSWSQPRFFSDRQAMGQELALDAEAVRQLRASDWLPLGGQAKLIKSACGRLPFQGP